MIMRCGPQKSRSTSVTLPGRVLGNPNLPSSTLPMPCEGNRGTALSWGMKAKPPVGRIPAALLSENIKPEMPLPAGLWGQRIEETHALHRLRTSDSLLSCFSSHSRVVICLGMPPHHITNPTTQPFVRCERISSPASRRPGPQRATAMFFPHFVGDACFYDS